MMTITSNAFTLLDSRSFRNKVDYFVSVAARKRPKPTDDELADALQPVLDAYQPMLIKLITEEAPRKERAGPAQAPIFDKEAPMFDMGHLGDAHDLPFDPFVDQSVEPNPVETRQRHGAMLVSALDALPEKGMGERHSFVMPIDWNAGEAAIFFDAAQKDGGKWALAENGIRLGFEDASKGHSREGWTVTAVRVR